MQNNKFENNNIEEINLDSQESTDTGKFHLDKQEGRSKRTEDFERRARGKTQDSGTRGTQYTRPGSDYNSESREYMESLDKKQGYKDIKEGVEEYEEDKKNK